MWLFVLLLLFVAWPFLLLLVIGLTAGSLASLVTAPRQLWELAKDRTRRRNHALEHATINVLEEKYGANQLAGFAEENGFSLQGAANPDAVLDAAREGLRRLQAGEKRLAWHPRCGTTILAANLVTAVSFIVLLIVLGRLSLVTVVLALLLATLLARPFGTVLQRFVTTSTDVGNLHITGFDYDAPVSWLGMLMGTPTRFHVYTSPGWVVLPPEKSGRRS